MTVDSDTYRLEEPFLVIATQNPIETAGTYQLPEAQLDRFLMKICMGYPEKDGEIEILNRFLKASPLTSVESVCSKEEVLKMQQEAKEVYVHPSLMGYIVDIAAATRKHSSVAIGVSPRGRLPWLMPHAHLRILKGENILCRKISAYLQNRSLHTDWY